MAQIGDIGERVDLLIRQGATCGPHEVWLTDSDDVAIDLTGCTLHGGVSKAVTDTVMLAPFTFEWLNQSGGGFQFSITDEDTATLGAGKDAQAPASAHVWKVDVTYADGTNRPLFWGAARVQPNLPPEPAP